jgi:hypothetical protein
MCIVNSNNNEMLASTIAPFAKAGRRPYHFINRSSYIGMHPCPLEGTKIMLYVIEAW